MTKQEPAQMLRIMPREMRMMTERIFSLTALPKGFYLAAPDLVMYSQKLGLGGFALLEAHFDSLSHADLARIRIVAETGARLRVDAGGQHAWAAVPCLIDLMGELVRRFGTAEIDVANVADPEELAVAAALASRTGLKSAFAGGPAPQLTASAAAMTGELAHDQPVLWDLLSNGTQIEAELWWRIYRLAQKALTPDSVVSRRHAGPLIVNEDGSIIGRKDNDDETDITFLTSPEGEELQRLGAQS